MLTKCVIAAADRTKTGFEPGEAEGMWIVENILLSSYCSPFNSV